MARASRRSNARVLRLDEPRRLHGGLLRRPRHSLRGRAQRAEQRSAPRDAGRASGRGRSTSSSPSTCSTKVSTCREIDTVLMLRPTESPIVFMQQLGRGLRTMEGKERLAVVDFIGNHRSFLLQATHAAEPRDANGAVEREGRGRAGVRRVRAAGRLLGRRTSSSVVDMLRELSRASARSGLEEYCRSYYEEEGRAAIGDPGVPRRLQPLRPCARGTVAGTASSTTSACCQSASRRSSATWGTCSPASR